ncbi:MAG TPA: hypothetical protein VK211_15735 [Kamptonema sp.]|nr:hypothetical protein [Kamptonema sp.]
MSEKKTETELTILSSQTLIVSYLGKEYEIMYKPKPGKKPEKKSVWNSIWVWFLVCLGINFIAGDPMGFTKTSSPQLSCHPDNLPNSEQHKPSASTDSGECSP